mgnify:FL=1
MELFHKMISGFLGIPERQISSTLHLLGEGATIPFISRYRKEATGGLDEVQIEQIKEQHRLQLIIALFIFCCLLIILFYQYHINKRKRIQLIYQQNLKQTQYKLSSMQTIIEDNQSIISLLQEEQRNLKQDQANKIDEIQERESTIERLRQEKHELRNWLFPESNI